MEHVSREKSPLWFSLAGVQQAEHIFGKVLVICEILDILGAAWSRSGLGSRPGEEKISSQETAWPLSSWSGFVLNVCPSTWLNDVPSLVFGPLAHLKISWTPCGDPAWCTRCAAPRLDPRLSGGEQATRRPRDQSICAPKQTAQPANAAGNLSSQFTSWGTKCPVWERVPPRAECREVRAGARTQLTNSSVTACGDVII